MHILRFKGTGPSWITTVAVSAVFGCAAGAVGTLLVIAFAAPALLPAQYIPETRPVGAAGAGVSAAGVEASVRALAYLAPARSTSAPSAGYVPSEAFALGMALTSDGWILTHDAAIVAKGKREMAIVVGGRASVVSRTVRDPYTGAVFIKIDASDLAVAPFGDSTDLAPGDAVFVVDAAGGIAQMDIAAYDARPTAALDGAVRSSEAVQRVLRLNGPDVLPGAMVFDRSGNVVAVIAEKGPLGTIAIPLQDITTIIGEVLRSGVAGRPILGLGYIDLARAATTALPARRGAHVASVVPGGPAAVAGLRAGDVILSVNAEPVSLKKDLSELVAEYAPGDKLTLAVQRGASTTELRIVATLGSPPAPATR